MDGYLELIMRYADDERTCEEKLSQCTEGSRKKDFHYNEKALLLANEWVEKGK